MALTLASLSAACGDVPESHDVRPMPAGTVPPVATFSVRAKTLELASDGELVQIPHKLPAIGLRAPADRSEIVETATVAAQIAETPPPVQSPTPIPVLRPVEQRPQVAAGSLEALVCSYPWPCGEALRVMTCESGGRNVQEAGGGPYVGPFQVGLFHARAGEDLWDVGTNVAVAFRIWSAQGWAPWSCRP